MRVLSVLMCLAVCLVAQAKQAFQSWEFIWSADDPYHPVKVTAIDLGIHQGKLIFVHIVTFEETTTLHLVGSPLAEIISEAPNALFVWHPLFMAEIPHLADAELPPTLLGVVIPLGQVTGFTLEVCMEVPGVDERGELLITLVNEGVYRVGDEQWDALQIQYRTSWTNTIHHGIAWIAKGKALVVPLLAQGEVIRGSLPPLRYTWSLVGREMLSFDALQTRLGQALLAMERVSLAKAEEVRARLAALGFTIP